MENVIHSFLYADEGDTCCAPMAAAIANHFAKERNLDCEFHSAGIYALEGTPVDPLAAEVLAELYGLDISGHKSVAVTPELHKKQAGLVRTMDNRLKAFYNDRAYAWPTDGCFSVVKPCGKAREEYVILAQYFYKNVSNQLDRLVKEGRILVKGN